MGKALVRSLAELEHIFRMRLGSRPVSPCWMDDGYADHLNRSELRLLRQDALGGGDDGISRIFPGNLIGLSQRGIPD